MTRTMFDSVTVAHLPEGGDLYAGYVNGTYKNVDQVRARFPGKPIVSITVNTSADADVLDVELGDARPEDAPFWCQRQRARGAIPTVYCTSSCWPEVRSAFRNQGIAEPNYWIADYANNKGQPIPPGFAPHIPTGAVACQYGGDLPGNYDQSIVADFWPGVDPAPATPTPQEDDSMKPVAGTPSWCSRQKDNAYPRFKGYLDGADAVVVSIDNAPFSPQYAPGDHGAYVDFSTDPAYGSLWCRRFKNAGEPFGFAEVAGAFFLIADHGTFDIAHK